MKTKMVFTVLGLATLTTIPAFAQKPTRAVQPAHLVSHGYTIGTDPDASVRFELNRDAPTYSVGN